MTELTRPSWLDAAPDQRLEHDYLSEEQISALPEGVFFKRKSRLTRHRYVKATLSVNGYSEVIEFVDNRGSWRIEPAMCERIAALAVAGQAPLPAEMPGRLGLDGIDGIDGADRVDGAGGAGGLDEATRRQLGILHSLGLAPLVLPMALPPAPGNAAHPRTMQDILDLYSCYTDMEAQGHFAEDSPDLERFRIMVSWVPRPARVLDLGCNSGTFGARLTAAGCRVTGVDLAAGLLRTAATRGVSVVMAFAEQLPIAAGSFDAVICGELLEHSLDPAAIAGHAQRVLRPGGIMIGSVPHADGQWGTEDLPYHHEHLWAFGPAALADLLHHAGLGKVETVDLHHGCDTPQGMVFRARKPG